MPVGDRPCGHGSGRPLASPLMPDRGVDILLIGGGIASATAAATLRDEGFEGSVLVVGRELDAPYHRPPATKGYLRGEEERAAVLVHPEGWWAEHDVELLTRTSVLTLDPRLQDGQAVNQGGGRLRPRAPGHRGDGAPARGRGCPARGHPLHPHARQRRRRGRRPRRSAEHVVCVGGSYVGCEVAASLTALGKRVTVLLMEGEPLGPPLRRRGRTARQGGARGARGGGRRAATRWCASRAPSAWRRWSPAVAGALPAGAVVCGVGAVPDVTLARRAGLQIGELGGVRCDSRLRTLAQGHRRGRRHVRVRQRPARRATPASSTRRSPRRRARQPRARCWAPTARTTSSPTSSPTLPTGSRWSTSGSAVPATRRSCAATPPPAPSASGTWPAAACAACSRSTAAPTSTRARELIAAGEAVGAAGLPG